MKRPASLVSANRVLARPCAVAPAFVVLGTLGLWLSRERQE
jgi:hypothetical protein